MASPARWTFTFLFVFLLNISHSGAIMCFACEQITSKYACNLDSMAIYRDRYKGRSIYSRNCSKMNEYMCRIEQIMNAEGVTVSFIRGCSDGLTFSYSIKDIPLLAKVKPNNETVCAFYNGQNICVTVCLTNYCNGPQGFGNLYGSGTRQGYKMLSVLGFYILIAFLL